MRHRWGSVILSGGQGRRMGGIDKGGLDFKGESFRGHIQKQLQALDIPCYLSRACYGGSGDREGGLEVIEDAVKGADGQWIGPMGGIWSCFQSTGLEGLFFVSCDMPLFRKEMALILMERWEPGVDAVLWRTRDGRIQPMCGFYAATCLGALGDTIRQGNYRLMRFLDAVRCMVVDTSEAHIPDIWFANVNSPFGYRSLGALRTPVMAVSGRKDTGKTTLLEMLVGELARVGIRSAVIKHDGHEFEADVPGTDSRRLKDAGAYGTVVYSATKFSMTKEQPSMEAEDFFSFFPEADIIFLEGQKYSDVPKLEVLRREVSNVPVCRPETVLAYIWSGENGWGGKDCPEGEACPGAENHRNGKCPVLTAQQTDSILELVIEYMDRYSRGDGGDEL
ncbi:MAG: molybdopterin-guanine dinucleotide biosynthesis protein B [Clostridia bacterium]|nr:molybdopterin-guanine dinucleotide biosynthesis protein B [Clostridia bacterium]